MKSDLGLMRTEKALFSFSATDAASYQRLSCLRSSAYGSVPRTLVKPVATMVRPLALMACTKAVTSTPGSVAARSVGPKVA